MNSESHLRFDVAVIGAGPAGIAAAVTAAESGASVVLIDDNPRPGGQIWRGGVSATGRIRTKNQTIKSWFERLEKSVTRVISGARVFQAGDGSLVAESDEQLFFISYKKLILATGAREFFIPFPGWTLSNVVGAGGLQAFLKSGLPVEGKRIVIAGTGPLLMAVAAYANEHGANVICICEQASWSQLARFALSMLQIPGKLREAVGFGYQLRKIPYWASCWPISASGKERLESVRLSRSGRAIDVPCDYLAYGMHLIPNTELAALLGCKLEGGFVAVDEYQQTSIPDVFCIGEPTGIGGVDLALTEGQIAGHAATSQMDMARTLFSQCTKDQKIVRVLRRTFQLRPELKEMAQRDTILCRCEDVLIEAASQHSSWRAAKLHTRCGMGACQGRICGPAAQFLFGWNVGSVRPPVVPVRCASLSAVPNLSANLPQNSQKTNHLKKVHGGPS